ncbi:MAG: glutamine--tRNA ligase/YqeY domain fusion protein [Elusimicrobiota bacterium]
MPDSAKEKPTDFIHEHIDADNDSGRFDGRVHTRFPPEPNGYMHIGHAMVMGINFGTAADYDGKCNLRFDDTNPAKEKTEFVEAIREDIRWLGFDWEDRLFYASDYFEQLHDWAVELIRQGKAYVCDLDEQAIREYRGTAVVEEDGRRVTPPGKDSPSRGRSGEENLDLFKRMRAGEFPDGSRTLRAKIDMAHPNLNMRDPVMYRILRAQHHRTGDTWCIYPSYDWAHGQSDSIEKITHSLCDVGFENHRPLYDWFLDQLEAYHPRQLEYGRMDMTHVVMSKRKLRELVESGGVQGWDDPRMPTVRGLRRRGYSPEGIRAFMKDIGITKRDRTVEHTLLEHHLREHLNKTAPRVMGVLKPLKVVITNYPEDKTEEFAAANNPEDESAGKREVPFSRELYIERDDFMEDPPRKFFRLAPGREVRLRCAYFITCTEVIKDGKGEVTELRCTYDPQSRGGGSPDGRRVKGTLHWVSIRHALKCEVRLYDHLFLEEDPEAAADWQKHINPASLTVSDGYVEPSLKDAEPGYRCQFERMGYFCVDPDSGPDKLVFNRTVQLKGAWKKPEPPPKKKKN